MIGDGNVVHSTPYRHASEMEKIAVDEVRIRGTEATPFLMAEMRSKAIIATIRVSAAIRHVIHHQRTPGVRHSGGLCWQEEAYDCSWSTSLASTICSSLPFLNSYRGLSSCSSPIPRKDMAEM
jgi:hypothetical protein